MSIYDGISDSLLTDASTSTATRGYADWVHTTALTGLKDTVTKVLKNAYNDIIKEVPDTGMTLEFYRSKPVVEIINTARCIVGNVIGLYYPLFGTTPYILDTLTLKCYAMAGGPDGLYLIMDIISDHDSEHSESSGISYRIQYPAKEIPEPGQDVGDDFINIDVVGVGCDLDDSVEMTDKDSELNEGLDGKFNTFTIKKGSYAVFHFRPKFNYIFHSLMVDGQMYTDEKVANDLVGITFARYTDGYELVVTDTTVDHEIVLTCAEDATTIAYKITSNHSGCSPDILTPVLVTSGASQKIKYTANKYHELSHFSINETDFTDVINKRCDSFKYTTAGGMTGDVTVLDAILQINLTDIHIDHEISISYVPMIFTVVGNMRYHKYNDTSELSILATVTKSVSACNDVIVTFDLSSYEDIGECYIDGTIHFVIDDVDDVALPYTAVKEDNLVTVEIHNVTRDCSFYIDLYEAPPTHTIVGVGNNCTISGAKTVTIDDVVDMSTVVFNIVVDEGYRLNETDIWNGVTVTVDGNDIRTEPIAAYVTRDDGNQTTFSLTFPEVVTDHTFEVTIDESCKIPYYTITGTGTNCTIDGETSVTTEKLEEGSDMSYTIEAPEDYCLNDFNGVKLTIDGTELTLDMADQEFTNEVVSEDIVVEKAYEFSDFGAVIIRTIYNDIYKEVSFILRFAGINADHTFSVELDESCKIPYYTITGTGTNCTIDGETSVTTTRILKNSDKTYTVTAYSGYCLNDFNGVKLTIDGTEINAFVPDTSTDGSVTYQLNVAGAHITRTPDTTGDIYKETSFELSFDAIEADHAFSVELDDSCKIPNKYTINAVMTNATTTNELPTEVYAGSSYTIGIDANEGTSFENVVFVLDKGTENEVEFVIDLDDEVNIFDQTIEGVPHIDNDGKIIRTRVDNHYHYDVNLVNIQNSYEVRFSTITIIT